MTAAEPHPPRPRNKEYGRTARQLTPRLARFVLNIFAPYVGAGVRVTHVRDDWRELRVAMRLRWHNRNAVGTHFGGSLYSMTDPHLMLMLQFPDEPVDRAWSRAIKQTRKSQAFAAPGTPATPRPLRAISGAP